MKRKLKISICIILSVVVICAGGFLIYVNICYQADETAKSVISDDKVNISQNDDMMVFMPKNPEYGLIFYQGGKVEYDAYSPLMYKLAKQNILCVVVKMPFNLAMFNIGGADDIQSLYPNIKHWYMCGHSLGGAMAAYYIEQHSSDFDGIIFLAAYSTADLSNTNLNVLSVYGSNDKVLNLESYQENFSHLPNTTKELVIDGGCHAYFGNYGVQSGDGMATISPDEQQKQTVDFIINNLKR
ncbi:MAG: alpha/beta hydrolase [Clostridia bacterium]|nr:alpha/beta hydrolase [Clostridia bacterium]